MPEKEGSAGVRLAATIMLVRPSSHDGALEVFMLRRSAHSAFAPDAFVFPGGTLEPADMSSEALQRSLGLEADRVVAEFRAQVPRDLPTTERAPTRQEAAGLFVAALRELFEEAGILLAAASDGQAIDSASWQSLAPRLREARGRLRLGDLTFAQLLESLGVRADARPLFLFSHWITPPSEPRRYDTHFFLARAPRDQAAFADAMETHDERWITPRNALEQNSAGTLHVVYPTRKHLERLTAFENIDDLFTYARTKPIATIMPATSGDGFAMPAELENAW